MQTFHTPKEHPYATIISEFPNDGTFTFPTGLEMFFYIIHDNGHFQKECDQRSMLDTLLIDHEYYGCFADDMMSRKLYIPIFEKRSDDSDAYDRAMSVIGKRI